MKKLTLVCFGKLKTPGFAASVEEFTTRISRYTQFQTIELKPIPFPEKSESLRSLTPEKEGEMLMELFDSPSFRSKAGQHPEIWCLDETGIALKTTEWAKQLERISDRESGELVIVIGSSLGLGDNIKAKAKKKMSFGPQTVSHELARLILVEQLFRALSYLEGHPYHNEG